MRTFTLFLNCLLSIVCSAQITIKYQEGHTGFLNDVRYSRDGRNVISSSEDKSIIVWETSSGRQIKKLQESGISHEHFDFLPNPDYIISGYEREDLIVWNWKTGQKVQLIPNPENESIKDLIVRPEHKQLVIVYGSILSGNSKWILYSFPEFEKLDSQVFSKDLIGIVEFNRDGSILAVGTKANASNLFGGSTQMLQLYDMQKRSATFKFDHIFDVGSIAFSHDNKIVATSESRVYGHKEEGPRFQFWDVNTGKEKKEWQIIGKTASHVDFSSNGKYISLAYSSADDGGFDVEIRDFNTFAIKTKLDTKANQLALFRPDGNRVICANMGHKFMEEFDVETGQKMSVMGSALRPVKAISISPDARLLASCSQSAFDQTVKIWDLQTGRINEWLKGHKYYPTDVQFSPDGKLLASCAKDGVRIWAVADWSMIRTSPEANATTLAWKDNNNLLIGFSSGTIGFMNAYDTVNKPDKFLQIATTSISKIAMRNGCMAIREKDQILYISPNKMKEYPVNSSNYTVTFLNDSILVADGLRGIYLINVITDSIEKLEHTLDYSRSLTISPDGKYAITGTGNTLSAVGDLHIWNLQTKKLMQVLKYHNLEVSDLTFDRKGRLFSASKDGKIGVWDWNSKTITTILVGNESEFITTTPYSFYTMSKNGHRFIAFESKDKLYAVDQFDLIYNRPDKIIEALSPQSTELIALYKNAIEKRISSAGTQTFSADNISAPQLEITKKESIPEETPLSNVSISLLALSQNFPLQHIDVWINGVMQSQLRHKFENKSYEERIDLQIPLATGSNQIEFSVWATNGMQSLRENVFVRKTGKSTSNLYVLCLSVSEYKDSSRNLKYARKDGRDIAQFFSNSDHQSQYNQIFIDTLFDQMVDREQIQIAFEKYKNLSLDDVLVVFISGHGLLDDKNNFYVASHDVDFDHPERRGIPFSDIENMLANCSSVRKILLIDACHSGLVDQNHSVTSEVKVDTESEVKMVGTFSRGGKSATSSKVNLENSFYLSQELFLNLNRGSGAQVISAAAGNAFAYESKTWQNGVFTFSMLKGLTSYAADLNNDKIISVSELRSFVTDEVVHQTKGMQKPTTRQENILFDWRIW